MLANDFGARCVSDSPFGEGAKPMLARMVDKILTNLSLPIDISCISEYELLRCEF